ncbi:putative ribonuclease H-like domain-containing protein [Tanacetum coccineum]
MGVTQLDMTSLRWSVSTATRWDILQGNTEDLGTKIAGTGIKTALEGLYMADDEIPTNMALMAFSDSGRVQQSPKFKGYGPKTSKSVSKDISNEVTESPDAPLVKELALDNKLEKKIIFPTVAKIEFVRPKQQDKQVRKSADYNYHQRERVVSGNNFTMVNYNYSAKKAHPSAHRNMVPRAILMKTGQRSLNTDRPVNTAHPRTTVYSARPMSHFSKSAQSTGHPQKEDQGYVDSGCSRHMTGNMLGHVNFKTINKLVKENLERGLPLKRFENDQTYVAWLKKASQKPPSYHTNVNTVGPSINTASTNINTGCLNINIVSPTVTTAPVEAIHADFFSDETEVDMSNITTTYPVPSTPNIRIHKDHSLDHVIGDVQSGVQTRRMTKTIFEQGIISAVYKGKTHEDLHTCLFACFLSQEEPKKVIQALKDPSWIEAIQEELLQFKLQQVWALIDLPHGKRAIGTKWVYRNKKDEKDSVIRNKARQVTQGYTQEEGIYYDEVFALVARIEVILGNS